MAARSLDTIDAYLDLLRASFSTERARGRAIVVQTRFTGRIEGTCYFAVNDGALMVDHGTHSSPSAVVDTDFDLWMRIASYLEDALLAYQSGKFTVSGDVEALLESDAWFVRSALFS